MTVDRETMHELLDRVLDLRGTAERTSDPDQRLCIQEAALSELMKLTAACGKDILVQRMISAAQEQFDQRPTPENCSLDDFAIERAGIALGPQDAAMWRRALMRLHLDLTPILPVGLAETVAVAMLELNLGNDKLPLSMKQPVPGSRSPSLKRTTLFVEASWLYYEAGLSNVSIETAQRKLDERFQLKALGHTLREPRTIQHEFSRNKHLKEIALKARAKGVSDRKNGHRYTGPELGKMYDLVCALALRRLYR